MEGKTSQAGKLSRLRIYERGMGVTPISHAQRKEKEKKEKEWDPCPLQFSVTYM
jgi:hypothetical protein